MHFFVQTMGSTSTFERSILDTFAKKHLKEMVKIVNKIKKDFKASFPPNILTTQTNEINEFEKEIYTSLDLFLELILNLKGNIEFSLLTLLVLFENYCQQSFVSKIEDKGNMFTVFKQDETSEIVWAADENIHGNLKIKLDSTSEDNYYGYNKGREIVYISKRTNPDSTQRIKSSKLMQKCAVLLYRHNIDTCHFIELNFLRNNLIGHKTEKIKRDTKGNLERKIQIEDVQEMLKILEKCLTMEWRKNNL